MRAWISYLINLVRLLDCSEYLCCHGKSEQYHLEDEGEISRLAAGKLEKDAGSLTMDTLSQDLRHPPPG
jgi:hypothetical protein